MAAHLVEQLIENERSGQTFSVRVRILVLVHLYMKHFV